MSYKKKAYQEHEITLNQVREDFAKSYMNLISFLRELNLYNYETIVRLLTTYEGRRIPSKIHCL